MGGNLQNRSPYLLRPPPNLFGRNHCRRRNQQMIARDAVHAALHGIDQQPSPKTCLPNQPSEILLRRERSLRLLLGNELNAPQQAQAADIADNIQIAQTFQCDLQRRPRRAFALRIRGVHQIQRPDAPQHRVSGSYRNPMRVVGKTVQKSTRASAIASTTFFVAITAPSGAYPEESPLAVTRMSGAIPPCSIAKCSTAKFRPVRPMPVMISSAISSTPWRRQISAIAGKYPGGGVTAPNVAPLIGSKIKPATLFCTAVPPAATIAPSNSAAYCCPHLSQRS